MTYPLAEAPPGESARPPIALVLHADDFKDGNLPDQLRRVFAILAACTRPGDVVDTASRIEKYVAAGKTQR